MYAIYHHFIDFHIKALLYNPIITGVVYHYEIGHILFSLFHLASLEDLVRRNKLIECTFRYLGENSIKKH